MVVKEICHSGSGMNWRGGTSGGEYRIVREKCSLRMGRVKRKDRWKRSRWPGRLAKHFFRKNLSFFWLLFTASIEFVWRTPSRVSSIPDLYGGISFVVLLSTVVNPDSAPTIAGVNRSNKNAAGIGPADR